MQEPGGHQAGEHIIPSGGVVQADRVERVAGTLCGDLPRLARSSSSTGSRNFSVTEGQGEGELVALKSSYGFGFQRGEFGVGVGRADVVDVPRLALVGMHLLLGRGSGRGGHGTDVRAPDC